MKRSIAALDLLLILPAAIFMLSLAVRHLAFARDAQRIVMWYAGRGWTLWILLIALPLIVLVTGGLALLRERSRLLAAETAMAGVFLGIVAVHMMMN
jgi:hypothetical protein